MGVYSELDIDQGCGDSPFEDDSGIPAFTDSELEGGQKDGYSEEAG